MVGGHGGASKFAFVLQVSKTLSGYKSLFMHFLFYKFVVTKFCNVDIVSHHKMRCFKLLKITY